MLKYTSAHTQNIHVQRRYLSRTQSHVPSQKRFWRSKSLQGIDERVQGALGPPTKSARNLPGEIIGVNGHAPIAHNAGWGPSKTSRGHCRRQQRRTDGTQCKLGPQQYWHLRKRYAERRANSAHFRRIGSPKKSAPVIKNAPVAL